MSYYIDLAYSILKIDVWFTKKRKKIPFSKETGTDNSIILSSWSCLVWLAAKLAHCETQRLFPDEDVPS